MDGRYRVYYDDQCEVCQAGVTWLRVLDDDDRITCVPIHAEHLPSALKLDNCLRELHVVEPDATVVAGWAAVTTLARLFPATRLIGWLGSRVLLRWMGQLIYNYVAANRYSLSRCRGGVCSSARPEDIRSQATMTAFWSCRAAGLIFRLPLILSAWFQRLWSNAYAYRTYFRSRIDLLEGKLSLCFLGGAACDAVPILFGEQFLMIIYDGVAIDPGSSKMRRSLRKHLRSLKGSIDTIAATHHHEEHVGNLEWLSERTGAQVCLTSSTLERVRKPALLPRVRRMVIGQPPPLRSSCKIIRGRLQTRNGVLQVIPTPGHCDDHVSFYDPQQKLLLAGDAYMGSYFATPNPDVDSLRWIESLERLLSMDIEIMVEGHGHIYTTRKEIPDFPGLLIRERPADTLRKRLQFFYWVRDQIELGRREGLPFQAVEASCFPWGQRWGWENFLNDELARVLSVGQFSRSELIRSFYRDQATKQAVPDIYQIQFKGP